MNAMGITPSSRMRSGVAPAVAYSWPSRSSTGTASNASTTAPPPPKISEILRAWVVAPVIAAGRWEPSANSATPTDRGVMNTTQALIQITYQYAFAWGESSSVTTIGSTRPGTRSQRVSVWLAMPVVTIGGTRRRTSRGRYW